MADKLEQTIRSVLQKKRVNLKEGTSLVDQEGVSNVSPTGVKPEWTELGAAPTHPNDELPDYGKGITAKQAALPKMHPTPGVGTTEGDGKTFTPNAVREQFGKEDDKGDDDDDDKKDDEKKSKVEESAEEENGRQYAKQKEGEPQHHVTGEKDDEKDASPKFDDKTHTFKEESDSKKDDDDEDEDDKKDMAEDVTALFAGEKLTEAFKKKASIIFEAAVNSRVKAICEKRFQVLDEQYEIQLNEAKEELCSYTDQYLHYVAEEWIKENTVAIESSLRADLTEEFIGGLRDLFQEHYIEVPQDKVDVLEALAERIEDLESELNKTISSNVGLKESISVYEKDRIINEACKSLTDAQADKLRQLSEGVSFKDAKSFKENVTTLKESHFVSKKQASQNLTEEKDPLVVPDTPKSSMVDAVLSALAKTRN